MADIVLGLFAIVAGAVILFAGQFVLRLVIPIWGFFAGFAFGAGFFAGLADERFLGTVFGAVSGYFGRWVDDAFNWFYSVFSSIPYLLLILAVAAVLQQKGTLTIILILGLTGLAAGAATPKESAPVAPAT